MTELGFALIGCGGMGRSEAKVLAQVPEARLVAVCDVQEQAAQAFGNEMGVPAYSDPAVVLGNADVGAVIVATPNGLHTQLVLDAAAAGKHIFCEKPMAFTVDECDRMIAAAEQCHVRLMVGQVLWLLPFYSRIVELFDSGLLGKPVAAQVTRTGWFGDPTALYRLRKATTGGQLYDITVHEIDLLHHLCGPARSVYAVMSQSVVQNMDYEDTVQLQIRYRSGAMASIFESLAAPQGYTGGQIIAERGSMVYDAGRRQISYRLVGGAKEPTVETVSVQERENGYLRELRSFTEWVLHGKAPLMTAREGRAAIAVVEAAYQSAQSGQPEEVRP